MTGPRIERLAPDNWARLRELRLRAMVEDPDAFGSTLAREQAFDEADWRARLDPARSVTVVAALGGVDAAIAMGAPYDGAAGLFGVWTDPAARGRGLGEAVVREVIEWARAAGHRRLLLDVGDAAAPATRLYARLGFERTGRTGTLPAPREHVIEHERALVL